MLRHLPPTASPVDIYTIIRSASSGAENGDRFRLALQEYLGTPACFLASSGRTALHLLLQSLKKQATSARTEVVLPAYTCPSVAKVIVDVGLQPRFVDIDPYSLSLKSQELAASVTDRTLAVVVVHPFGIPVPLQEALQIARDQGAYIIEDAAQSMGARMDGQLVGTQCDFGLFSLGPGKPLSTGGGGFIAASALTLLDTLTETWSKLRDPSRLDSFIAAMRLGAFNAAFHPTGWWVAQRLGAQKVGENEASWRYALTGLTSAQAAVGLHMLHYLESLNNVRHVNADALMVSLENVPDVHLFGQQERGINATADEHLQPIYLRCPVLVQETELRDRLVEQLNEAGIGAGRMYARSLPNLFPQFSDRHYPGADQVASCLMTLPTHAYVEQDDITKMTDIISKCVSEGP